MSPKEITELKDAIRINHGCEALHVESVPVKEVAEGKTIWEGAVEVFDLVGHPKAKRAYAWSHRDGDEMKPTTVLQVAPADSPERAVKMVITNKSGSNQHGRKRRLPTV
jgi:hypothetical protein